MVGKRSLKWYLKDLNDSLSMQKQKKKNKLFTPTCLNCIAQGPSDRLCWQYETFWHHFANKKQKIIFTHTHLHTQYQTHLE